MNYLALLIAILAAFILPTAASAEEGTFDSKGVKIRYVTEGKGEAVVLIHGWLGDSSMWGRDAKGETKLSPAEGYQVIALDCRGHGKSDKPHDKEKYGAEMAEDVVRLLDHLKIKKAHLIGYSMGTFIAGKVVAAHPERVISVIYGGQAPLLPGPKSTEPGEVEMFAKAVEDGKGMGPYLIAYAPQGSKLTLEQANSIADYLYKGKDLKAFAAAGLSFGQLEVNLEDLIKAKVPSLFIHGSKEPASTKDRAEKIRKAIGAELKVIEGADHMTTLSSPVFGQTIMEFLKTHKGGG